MIIKALESKADTDGYMWYQKHKQTGKAGDWSVLFYLLRTYNLINAAFLDQNKFNLFFFLINMEIILGAVPVILRFLSLCSLVIASFEMAVLLCCCLFGLQLFIPVHC